MFDILFGKRPSCYEDLNGTYKRSFRGDFWAAMGVSAWIMAALSGFVFRTTGPREVWTFFILGSACFLVWVLANIASYIFWLRKERVMMLEAITAPKVIPPASGPSPSEQNLEAGEVPEWMAKIWNGRIVDDSGGK